jgi:hypothetical protein
MTGRTWRAGWGAAVLTLVATGWGLGCGSADAPGTGAGVREGSTGAEESTGGTTGAGWPSRPPMVSASEGGASSEDDGVVFLLEPDGGGSSLVECDVYAQDCPLGERCGLWFDGGDIGSRCMELEPEPVGKGQPCHYEGGLDGHDDCDLGLTCWDLDAEGNGVCIAMCTGNPSNPTCADPNDVCVGKDFLFCFPRCYPLDDNCPAGCGCYPTGDEFGCFPDASGDMGTYGDPCEFINVCDPGHVCLNGSVVPGCAGASGCCSPFCELDVGGCPDGLECHAWFEEGAAPPWYESLGVCALLE